MPKYNLTQCIRGGALDGRSGYLLKFDYDAELVETLKRAIPHTEREWREEDKTWWVSIRFDDALKLMFSNFEALAHWQGVLL
jgi:hypothetical protein